MDIVVFYDDGKVHNIEDIVCINNDQDSFHVLLKDDTLLHLVREDVASIKIYGGKYD